MIMFSQWVMVLFSFHEEGEKESMFYGGSEIRRFIKLG